LRWRFSERASVRADYSRHRCRSLEEEDRMATVSVRYIVNDVDEAIEFYCQRFSN
jgi:hypothetical protein